MKDKFKAVEAMNVKPVIVQGHAHPPNDMHGLIPAAPSTALPVERFRSSETWNENRIAAVAMYCSDGRWGEAFDEFCHRSLVIPRYDRFAVPGGPAWLIAGQEDAAAPKDPKQSIEANLSRAAWDQLSFLVSAHQLQRIVLVAHYGCGYYADRLKRDADACLPVQIEDLKTARAAVKKRFPRVSVEAYLAMRNGERLSFHGECVMIANDEDDSLDEDPENPDKSDMDDDEGDEFAELMECPYCKAEMYENAEQCPHCGNYISREVSKSSQPLWLILGLIACVIVVLFFWIGHSL